MSTMNISLPDEMRAWVESEVSTGGFGSASEYFRQLVREAKVRKEAETQIKRQEQLESLLLAGLAEGAGEAVTPQWWATFRAEMADELKKRQDDLTQPDQPQAGKRSP